MINLFILIAAMTLMGAYGSLCLKKAALSSSFFKIAEGFFWYGTGMILNILALKYYEYTVVFPLTSLTYIWSFIFGVRILHEKYTRYNLAGIILIIGGAFLLSVS